MGEELQTLAGLHASGMLTEEQFEAAKTKLVGHTEQAQKQQVQKLEDLHANGVLTAEQFETAKAKLRGNWQREQVQQLADLHKTGLLSDKEFEAAKLKNPAPSLPQHSGGGPAVSGIAALYWPGGPDAEQLQHITPEALASLPPTALGALPAATIAALPKAALAALTPAAIDALSPAAIEATQLVEAGAIFLCLGGRVAGCGWQGFGLRPLPPLTHLLTSLYHRVNH